MGLFGGLNPFRYSRKYYAAWNALMAAYTFEQLSKERKQQVIDKVVEIESSVMRRPVKFIEVVGSLSTAQRFHLFSLAMMNCEIRPALGDELWFEVKNPHADLLNAEEVIRFTKHQLKKKFRVKFPEL